MESVPQAGQKGGAIPSAVPPAPAACFDRRVNSRFPELVVEHLAPLVDELGFAVIEDSEHRVVLESSDLRCTCVFDPRGELDVQVSLIEKEDWEGWTYVGMVGTASLARLLDLALDEMKKDPRVLAADVGFYSDLAERRHSDAREYNAFAQGLAPRPRRERLP